LDFSAGDAFYGIYRRLVTGHDISLFAAQIDPAETTVGPNL
jgi:hypothetical protein